MEDLEDDMGQADDPYGMISLSKRKAEKIITWQEMMRKVQEGEVVTGKVTRKIKGGLLVDIGVNVFLPASQVDIRRPHDIGDYIGRVRPVRSAQDRRNPAQHRRQPPQPDRETAAGGPRSSCWRNWKKARFARAWSRTSPSSARLSIWAGSTACCTSRT